MRIGVITTSFPRWSGDFAGSFVEASVRRLVDQGHTVDVIAAGTREPRSEALPLCWDDFDCPGARVMRLAVPDCTETSSPSLFYSEGAPEVLEKFLPASWLQAAAFCARLCDQIRACAQAWDEIHAHWLVPSALLACAVGASSSSKATVKTGGVRGFAHSGDVALLERLPAGRALARWLAAHVTEITFASRNLRERFRRLEGGSVSAGIYRVQAAAKRHRQSACSARPADDFASAMPAPVVLAVGRLVPIKGFDVLIKAAALSQAAAAGGARAGAASSVRPPVVVILGEGPERSRLRASALRLGVDLRLPGTVPSTTVGSWLAKAALYVQPSRTLFNGRTEGVPVSTLQALDQGVPVVASDSGGLVELATSGGAVRLFPSGDYRALARLIAGVSEWGCAIARPEVSSA